MPRVVIDPRNVHDGAIAITDHRALHHLLDVLRVTEGERVECVDGAGRWYAARVARGAPPRRMAGRGGIPPAPAQERRGGPGSESHRQRDESRDRFTRELRLEIVDQGEEPRSALAIRLVQALIKPERFDWLVQKATELGVERISPVMTSRSVIRVRGDPVTRAGGPRSGFRPIPRPSASGSYSSGAWPSDPEPQRETGVEEGATSLPVGLHRISGRMARWQRIAVEAAQQCGRATVPRIDDPVAFHEAMLQRTQNPGLVLLPTLAVPGRSLREVIGDRGSMTSSTVLIGPEGDFTQKEVAFAQRHGAVPVSLGRRTLRSETAAVAVLAILQHVAGEL